jgi:predicted HTH transcriptional regulator
MEEGQKEEVKESEGVGTLKEETLSEEKLSTETPTETHQIERETPTEKAPPEAQPEVEGLKVETREIFQEVPPTEQMTQPPPQPEASVQPEPSRLRQLWQRFLESLKGRKAKRLEKILQLVREKGEITNDDVERLLRVSDKTATRYLNELVREGKLKRLGSPSHAKYQIP